MGTHIAHVPLVPYVLSRWKCNAGCGTFERGTYRNIDAASPTCTKCGRSATLLMTSAGLTREKLPFYSLPKIAAPNGYIRPSKKYGDGQRVYRGGSTGRPRKEKVQETQPRPEEVRLPGEKQQKQQHKQKSKPKKGSTANGSSTRKQIEAH